MAISFSRVQFVKRSGGKNACSKSAYNARDKIDFEGTKFSSEKSFDWSEKGPVVHHEMLLPAHASDSLKDKTTLWNLAERSETRANSQVALEMVLALPDDRVISVEDRIELARSFVQEHFVKHGLASQLDIHPPVETGIVEEEGEKTVSRNWHAHVLVTTRRVSDEGTSLASHKARDRMPDVRRGVVVAGENYSSLWTEHQNGYFIKRGLTLRVDPNGAVPQRHLGPVRMRARSVDLLRNHHIRIERSSIKSAHPDEILSALTKTQSLFSKEDVDRFIVKHVPQEGQSSCRDAFWRNQDLVKLLDLEKGEESGKYSTHKIVAQERAVLRLADRMRERESLSKKWRALLAPYSEKLNSEQRAAFEGIVRGSRLSCLEGHAGTGKSRVLSELSRFYRDKGLVVRGLGPDSATAKVLRIEKGIKTSENVDRFLWGVRSGNRTVVRKGEVWLVDEAGKLGAERLSELFKVAERKGVQVVLSGCSAQMPSVSRGDLFKVLSDRYQPFHLEDIQRQKQAHQKEIAKSLATGQIGAAFDHLAWNASISWDSTKQEAIEALIGRWAGDWEANKNQRYLIIAHSRHHALVLNEMVHAYLREKGEVSSKEYQCDNAFGRFFVSVGDKIEFRRNDNDLGVTNGMVGTLDKASSERFSVRVTEEGQERTIRFDPGTYSSFCLGYATTYYRSQGQTVDRAYVLHSSATNRPMFYVGLTRHVHDVSLFVCREEATCLEDLKRQAFKDLRPKTTLEFTTESEIEEGKRVQERKERISTMKASDSLLRRLGGKGLEIVDSVGDFIGAQADRRSDREFYRLEKERVGVEGRVSVVDELVREELVRGVTDRARQVDPESKPMDSSAALKPRTSWNHLSRHQKELIKTYYSSCDQSNALRTIYKSSEGELSKEVAKQEWLSACGERNRQAAAVMGEVGEADLRKALPQTTAEALLDRSDRYTRQQEQRKSSVVDLDRDLKNNLGGLLHRLFPDGMTGRDARGLRFGSKGSLSVCIRGENVGKFYDFQEGVGGGPLQLIQSQLGVDALQAKAWAREFLGGSQDAFVPRSFSRALNGDGETKEWVPTKPPQDCVAPSLEAIGGGLHRSYRETARHTYRDAEGSVLYHTLRLESIKEEGKKIVLPLSYGQFCGEEEEPTWRLKGYQTLKKPLYGLDRLAANPQADVLVVEGEKTADAVAGKYPDRVVVSWSGGAGAVSKSDWSPLSGRNVLIWPDHDEAGSKAGLAVAERSVAFGADQVRIVNPSNLSEELPRRWDLADELPKGLQEESVRLCLLMSENAAPNIEGVNVLSFGSGPLTEDKGARLALVRDLVARSMASVQEHGSFPNSESRKEIEGRVLEILNSDSKLLDRIGASRSVGVSGDKERLLVEAMRYQAQSGREPSDSVLEKLREGIREEKGIGESFQRACDERGRDVAVLAISKADEPALIEQEAKKLQEMEICRASKEKEGPSLDLSL